MLFFQYSKFMFILRCTISVHLKKSMSGNIYGQESLRGKMRPPERLSGNAPLKKED